MQCTPTPNNFAVKLLRDTTIAQAEVDEPVRFGRLGKLMGYNFTRGQLKTRHVFEQAAEGTDLRPSELAVLLLVEATPGIKQITLADVLSVDRSTMVRIVDRCEEAGLLRRGSSTADRRVAPLQLTADGKASSIRYIRESRGRKKPLHP